MSIARATAYTLVRQTEEEQQATTVLPAGPRTSSVRSAACLTGLGLLAAFYMFLTARSASATTQGSKHTYSLLGRYEKLWLTTKAEQLELDNAALKAQLEKLQRELETGNSRAMDAAAQKAATPPPQRATAASVALPANLLPTSPQASSSAASSSRGGGAAAPMLADNGYRLTKELIRSRCNAQNIILVTFVNSKRADYGYTWAAHIRRLNLTNYLVGAMDGDALKKLSARAIPTFDMESGLTTADYGWGTKNFRQLGLRKTELIITLLRAGADPVLTDADALITRDPTPFIMRTQPEAQILVTSDHLMSTTAGGADELETPERAVASAWNIGYMYLRHDVLHAMLHWQAECVEHPNLWDQNLFKDVLKIGGLKFRQTPTLQQKRIFKGYNGTIGIGILPVATFCSGHTYFIQRMPQRRGVLPYSVHTTFQYSGAVGKTHRLREAMLWEDEPSYFTPPKNLLTYTPVVRRELIKKSGVMDVESHFTLVHHQLTQLRAAMVLARKLDRLLILPELVCGLDRFWAPHNGTIPGSDTQLPIDPCPADHVVDLENIARQHRGSIEGIFREYSFLSNPRTPLSVTGSTRTLAPPRDLSPIALAALTDEATKRVRVLKFERMTDLVGAMPRDELEAEVRRMRDWTSIWCCSVPLSKKSAGHVWYDMFWDIIPHTNRHQKLIDAPWKPSFGP